MPSIVTTSNSVHAPRHNPWPQRKKNPISWAFLAACLAALYPFLAITYSFIGSSTLKLATAFTGFIALGILLLTKTKLNNTKKAALILFTTTLFLWGWYGALWTEMRNYGVILTFLSCAGVAWAALEFDINKQVYEYPFYIFLLITIILILTGTDQYEFNQILATGSRNVYSAILIALTVGYLFSKIIRNEKPAIILGVSVFVASFFLYSRTGLALSTFLLLCFFAANVSKKKIQIIILSIFSISLTALFFTDIIDFIERNSNFSKGIDSPRFEIWRDYISNVGAFNIFFGYDMSKNALISEYGGNPHSAYLRLHSYYGAGLYFLLFISLHSIFRLAREKKWIFLSFAVVFFFRAAFDPVYFISDFDYIFYPFAFYFFFSCYFRKNSEGEFRHAP